MDIARTDLKSLINLDRVQRLCDDLSQVLGLDIEIFNNRHESFYESPRPPRPGESEGSEADADSQARESARSEIDVARAQVLREGKVATLHGENGNATFLIPIGARPAVFGVVVATQSVCEARPRRRSISGVGANAENGESRVDREILGCLENIAAFIADDCYQRLEIENLTSELSDKYEELNLIYDIGRNIKADQSRESTIQFLIDHVSNVLETSAFIYASNDGSYFRSGTGTPDIYSIEDINRMDAIRRRFAAEVEGKSEPLVVNNLPTRCEDLEPGDDYSGLMVVPIRTAQKDLFMLNVFRGRGADFMSGDVKLMEALGRQAAIMIENADLFHELEALFLNTLAMLVNMIEARDEYTRGHSERVRSYSVSLGRAVGLSRQELRDLTWGSLLHDFGKVKVPDSIIKKPARLNPEEWAIIRQHPSVGAMLLRPIKQLQGAIPGVELHHERWDGKGYPHGLKGDQTPLQGRIVGIADAYDALASKRAYSDPMAHIDALAEIERNAGTQFDPELVGVLARAFPDRWEIPESEGEPEAELKQAA
ncbi:MAG: HD domain-containing protein [Myxococcales bacterium]|nr:HD domain-containing protein [Myxococcales bacterium]